MAVTEDQFSECWRNVTMIHQIMASWQDSWKSYRYLLLNKSHIYSFMVVEILTIIAGFISNILLFVAILRRRRLHSIRPYDLFVGNMAMSNVICYCVGWSVVTTRVFYNELWYFGESLCKTSLYFLAIFSIMTIIWQTWITVDRLLRVNFARAAWCPKLTPKTAKIAVALTWLVIPVIFCEIVVYSKLIVKTFGTCSFPLCLYFNPESADSKISLLLISAFSQSIPCLLMFVLNICVAVSLIRYRWQQQRNNGNANDGARLTLGSKDVRAVKIILISGVFVNVCWTLFLVIFEIEVFFGVSPGVFLFGRWVGCVYAAILPFIYGTTYGGLIRRTHAVRADVGHSVSMRLEDTGN